MARYRIVRAKAEPRRKYRIIATRPRKYRVVIRSSEPKSRYRIVKTRTEARFIPVYKEWEGELWALSSNQYVPGWDHEDRFAMMAYCLWEAWRKHDPSKGDLGKFFWSIWLNQRAKEIKRANRKMRSGYDLVPYEDGILDIPLLDELCPIDFPSYLIDVSANDIGTSQQEAAWKLLAIGWEVREVQKALGIRPSEWKRMVEAWRTETVHGLLTEGW